MVLRKIASGLFETNAVKASFELKQEPFLNYLTNMRGFKSDAVQIVVKKMQRPSQGIVNTFDISFWSTERVNCDIFKKCFQRFYFMQKLIRFSKPTKCCMFFFSPLKKKKAYQVNQVLSNAKAIIDYRAGLRGINQFLIHSDVWKDADLIHGNNYSFYQTIEVYNLSNYLLMKTKIQEIISKSFAMSLIYRQQKIGISF